MAAKARLMQRLWRLLQRLPLERRRKVLERFTASQKRALECWILGNAVAVPQAFGPRRVTLASTLKEQSPAVGTGSSQNIVRYKRGKVTYYAAQMHLGSGLRMLSKTERCLQVAQSHELLLRRVRETCRSAVVHDECMGQAIRESLADLADEAKRIGLRFVVQIRIPWSCCALTSPPFRLRNLELGLRSWQRLHEARTAISSLAKRTRRGRANLAEPGVQRAWQQLREAYLASTKHSPRAISRLQLLEEEFRLRRKRDLEGKILAQKAQEMRLARVEAQLEALLSRWNEQRKLSLRHCTSLRISQKVRTWVLFIKT